MPTPTPSYPARPGPQVIDARQKALDVGVAEAPLPLQRGQVLSVPPVSVIRGREHHDRQSDGDGGVGHRLGHLVGVVVRGAIGLVVDVVKLAHDAVAGAAHLVERLQRHRVHRLGGEAAGQREHFGAPGPEVVGPIGGQTLGPPSKPALKRVGMGVGHGRDAHHTRLGSVCRTSSTATSASARSMSSAGEWLMPVGLRTNTIAAGSWAASTPAS